MSADGQLHRFKGGDDDDDNDDDNDDIESKGGWGGGNIWTQTSKMVRILTGKNEQQNFSGRVIVLFIQILDSNHSENVILQKISTLLFIFFNRTN